MEGVMSTPTTRRGCLKVPSTPGTPNSLRKSVAFCAACDGLEEVHFADEWDRTATEPTKTPLSYQDILELKAIQRTLPRAPQLPDLYTGKPASQYLSAVPIGLLPLLPGDHPGTPHPTPVSTPNLTPTTSKEPTPAQTPSPSIPTSPDPLLPSSPPLDPSSPPMSPSKMPPNPLLELYPNPPHSPLSPPTPGHTPHFPYSYTYPNSHSTTPGHMPGRLKQPSPERATSKTMQAQSSSAIWRNYSPPSHLPIGAKIPSNSSSPSHTPARVSSPAPSIPPSIPAPAPAPAVPSYLAHLLPKKPSGLPKRKPNLSFLPLLESTPVAPSPLSSQIQQQQPISSPELVAQLEGSRGGSKTPTPESIARVLEGLAQVQSTSPSSTIPEPEPEQELGLGLGLGLGLESDSVSTTTPNSDSRTSSSCTSSTATTAPSSAEVTPKICKAGLVSEDQRVNVNMNLGSSLSSSTSCASDHHLHNEEEHEEEYEYRDTAPPTPALTTTSLMTETEESELETDVDVDEVPRLKEVKKGLGSQLRMTSIQGESGGEGEKDYFGSSLGLGLTRRSKPKERKPKEKKKEVMWINGMEVEIDGDDDDDAVSEEDGEPLVVVVQEKPKEKKKKKIIKKEKEVIWINGEMEEMETEVEVEVDDDSEEEADSTPSSKSSPKPKKPLLYHQSRSAPAGSLSQSTSTSSTSSSSSCPSNLDSTLGFGLDPSSARSARRRKPPPPLLNNPGERIVSLPEVPTRARTPASSANVSPVESASGSGAASPVPPASPIDECGPGLELELGTPTTATVRADANPCSAGTGPSPPSNRFRLNIVGLA